VKSAGGRLFEILDEPSKISNSKDAVALNNVQGSIIFENVSFDYQKQDSKKLINNISFTINPGEKIGIIGRTGTGKSTLLHLLSRFYDINDGNIYIDNKNIKKITIKSLRQIFGIVQQDIFLFPGTIKENISYGKPDATLIEIKKAATLAHINKHIESLPDQYETWVGENGVSLSGGQKQRISIARTLLTNPPILILDDVTSSVDLKTELEIEKSLEKILVNKSSITVTHRTKVMKKLDKILFIEDGKIQDQGKHDELYATNQKYRSLCQSFENKNTKKEVR
jgi:ATP-binding cassette subfamily B protein